MSANKRKVAETMRPRIFAFVATLGAVAAVLGASVAPQAFAAPSEAKLELNENCFINTWACWAPAGSGASKPQPATTTTIAAGGELKFADNANFDADVIWMGSAPVCSGVPTSPSAKWEGGCKLEQPGTYKFESPTLFKDPSFDYTKYEVVVAGATPPMEEPTTEPPAKESTPEPPAKEPTPEPPAQEPSPTPTPTPIGGNPTATTSSSPSSGSPSSGQPVAGPASGSPFESIELASPQHSSSVHGTIEISQAGAGGRLEVALLTTTASLAKAKHSSKASVGRFLQSSLKAGVVSFAVPLTSKAKSALRRYRHLALTVQIVVTPVHGATVTVTKNVVLRG